MKYRAFFALILSIYPSLVFAGGTGGGGSPPAELLPDQQFTEVVLGILRGEDIQPRSPKLRPANPGNIMRIPEFEDFSHSPVG